MTDIRKKALSHWLMAFFYLIPKAEVAWQSSESKRVLGSEEHQTLVSTPDSASHVNLNSFNAFMHEGQESLKVLMVNAIISHMYLS